MLPGIWESREWSIIYIVGENSLIKMIHDNVFDE